MTEQKRIKLITPDGNSVEFDQQTSEALYLYAQAKGITVEQTIDEVFKRFIQLKEENGRNLSPAESTSGPVRRTENNGGIFEK